MDLGFGHPRVSWNQSLADTEGLLYLIFVLITKQIFLCLLVMLGSCSLRANSATRLGTAEAFSFKPGASWPLVRPGVISYSPHFRPCLFHSVAPQEASTQSPQVSSQEKILLSACSQWSSLTSHWVAHFIFPSHCFLYSSHSCLSPRFRHFSFSMVTLSECLEACFLTKKSSQTLLFGHQNCPLRSRLHVHNLLQESSLRGHGCPLVSPER